MQVRKTGKALCPAHRLFIVQVVASSYVVKHRRLRKCKLDIVVTRVAAWVTQFHERFDWFDGSRFLRCCPGLTFDLSHPRISPCISSSALLSFLPKRSPGSALRERVRGRAPLPAARWNQPETFHEAVCFALDSGGKGERCRRIKESVDRAWRRNGREGGKRSPLGWQAGTTGG